MINQVYRPVWDSKERIVAEARKYSSRSQWKRLSAGSWAAAKRLGYLLEINSFFKKRRTLRDKWTNESIEMEARKYKTIKEWRTLSPQSYHIASEIGFLKMGSKPPLGPRKPMKWSDEALILESKNHSGRLEWKRAHNGSYSMAIRRGFFNRHPYILPNKAGHGKWATEELIAEDAKKYSNKSEWIRRSSGAYEAALKKGIVEKVTFHMKKMGGISQPEAEILSAVKKIYPNACQKWFSTDKIVRFLPTTRFQVDIYIPELNKGIEFDGKYWHGEGFKRSWTSDPSVYHATKDSFFKERGISLLHIKEEDWLKNKNSVQEAILKWVSDGTR